jgi:hypothetical protein
MQPNQKQYREIEIKYGPLFKSCIGGGGGD